jgi:hypothetical protein
MGGKIGGKTSGRPRAFSAEFQAHDYAIRNAIGRMLRAQYDVVEPLPKQLANLVSRLDGADAGGGCSGATNARSAPGAGARSLPKPEPATA